MNDMLGSAAPEKALGRKVTVEEVLAEAEKKIDTAFTDQPVMEAAIRHTLGGTHLSLGKYEAAEFHLTRAAELRTAHLGPDHPDTLKSMHRLASLLRDQGEYAEAQKLNEETLGTRRRVLGPEHMDMLHSMNNLALDLWLFARNCG